MVPPKPNFDRLNYFLDNCMTEQDTSRLLHVPNQKIQRSSSLSSHSIAPSSVYDDRDSVDLNTLPTRGDSRGFSPPPRSRGFSPPRAQFTSLSDIDSDEEEKKSTKSTLSSVNELDIISLYNHSIHSRVEVDGIKNVDDGQFDNFLKPLSFNRQQDFKSKFDSAITFTRSFDNAPQGDFFINSNSNISRTQPQNIIEETQTYNSQPGSSKEINNFWQYGFPQERSNTLNSIQEELPTLETRNLPFHKSKLHSYETASTDKTVVGGERKYYGEKRNFGQYYNFTSIDENGISSIPTASKESVLFDVDTIRAQEEEDKNISGDSIEKTKKFLNRFSKGFETIERELVNESSYNFSVENQNVKTSIEDGSVKSFDSDASITKFYTNASAAEHPEVEEKLNLVIDLESIRNRNFFSNASKLKNYDYFKKSDYSSIREKYGTPTLNPNQKSFLKAKQNSTSRSKHKSTWKKLFGKKA